MTATDALSAGQNTQDILSRPEAVEMPALSIDGVSHSYGTRQALIDIGFIVAPASFTALLGLTAPARALCSR